MVAHRQALVLASIVLAGALAGCGRTTPFDGPAKHVVFFSLDTTRADHLGLYGNEIVQTPNLDRLAAESIVLDDYMTTAPTTLASHASLFTGKYPHTHGTPRNGFVINDENVLLAELLREQGFVTAGFAGSFALASRFGIAQGMDHFDEEFALLSGRDEVIQDERSAEAVTDAVLDWLDGTGFGDNLFLFVHYFDSHAPYVAPAPYDTMYDDRGRTDLPDWFSVSQACSQRPGRKTEVDQRMAAQYAGEISYMDHHIGRLLDALRERGILDEALVVVTSDHGENLWEHGACFDHGWNLYQTTIHSVAMMRLPNGLNGGARVGTLVSSIDILPSVLGYLGLPLPDGVEGEAIDLENPRSASDRVRFSQATKPWKAVETDPRWTNMLKARAIRDGSYKLVQVPYRQQEELYDLSQDPLEQSNLLASSTPDVVAVAERLRARLEAWAASAQPLPTRFETSQQEETIRRLKALGYIGE